MIVLVTYDVATAEKAGQRRLQKVAKTCQDFGQRVQNSVFECSISMEQFVRLRAILLELIDLNEDSVRFYFLGNNRNWRHRVEHHGTKAVMPIDDPLIL
ncbi:MAG: CRISPR-associated endonuclease Cas2 [Planctomycetales bacterium]|nr:CRISPR-associated endonuclease Cas2 [Planctomycetales bacterium]